MDLDEAERHVLRATSGYAPDGDVVISRAALRRYASEFEEDRAALADAQAEIARLRAAAERYEILTPQVCPAGEHPEWLIDSEHHHACPWCEIARLRAALDAVRERHAKYDDGTCWEDGKDWPCPTVRALAAAPAPAEDEDEEA